MNAKRQFEQLLGMDGMSAEERGSYVDKASVRGWETFKHLPDGRNQRLLDVGSAGGLFVPVYCQMFHFKDVATIDLGRSSEAGKGHDSKKDERGSSYTAYHCDIETEQWPIEDAQFDVVVGMEVLEHMVFDPMFAMNEICRVLKPGGIALITVPNAVSDNCLCYLLNNMQPGMLRQYFSHPLSSRPERDVETIRNLGHFHEYTSRELSNLALAAGFAVEKLTSISSHPPILDSFKFRLVKTLVRCVFPHSERIRGDHLVTVLRKTEYRPLEEVAERYPTPLYRIGRS